jgi:hypothetical protein
MIHDGRRCEGRQTWPHPAATRAAREAGVEELAFKILENGKLSLEIR